MLDKGPVSWSRAGAFLSALSVLVALAFADGGYFRESWTWTVVALSSLAGIALLLRERVTLGRLELVTIGALASFVAWTALSATWSSAPTNSLHDAERGLIYVTALLALALVATREDVRELLAGVAVGISVVAAYGLGERLFASESLTRDPVEGTLLIEPLGYANALGILAAIGALLCLGFAAHERTRGGRALGAAAPMFLVATLTLTESRGAWLALAVGLGVTVLLDTRREQLLAATMILALPAATVVWLTERSSALTEEGATAAETSEAGRRLALALAVLALASGLASLGIPWVAARLSRRRGPRVVLVALALGLPSAAVIGAFSTATLGLRGDYWRVAWDEFEENPRLGSGSGTFVQYWQTSGTAAGVQDAHNVYLETLAELGPLGLLLLLVALGLPLLAALRGPGHPLVGVAAAAYAAYLVHAGLDWDWEMPAVTLAGLFCGVALLAAARPGEAPVTTGSGASSGLVLAVVALPTLAVAARLLVQ